MTTTTDQLGALLAANGLGAFATSSPEQITLRECNAV